MSRGRGTQQRICSNVKVPQEPIRVPRARGKAGQALFLMREEVEEICSTESPSTAPTPRKAEDTEVKGCLCFPWGQGRLEGWHLRLRAGSGWSQLLTRATLSESRCVGGDAHVGVWHFRVWWAVRPRAWGSGKGLGPKLKKE